MNIEGISLHVLTNELNSLLSGGRISRILQPTHSVFVLQIRQPQQDYSLLISIDPGDPRVHITHEARENPLEPSSFCMLLRKHLVDGRIAAIVQEGLDRVLHIQIDIRGLQNRIDTKTLTVELTGKNSNLIFCINDVIVDATRRVGHNTSRVRQIMAGLPYVPPPTQERLNPLQTSPESILAAVGVKSDTTVSKALQTTLEGIGQLSAIEVLHHAGLPTTIQVGQLDAAQQYSLVSALRTVFAIGQPGSAAATVVLDESGRLIALSAFPLSQFTVGIHRSFATFNEAIGFAAGTTKAPKTVGHQDLIRRLRTEAEKLHRKLALLTQEHDESNQADTYRCQADLLMAHMLDIPVKTEQVSLPNLFVADAATAPELLTISLDPLLSPLENAQRYYKKYARAKRAQELILEQLRQCRDEIDYVDGLQLQLAETTTNQELLEITYELAQAGYINSPGKTRLAAKPSDPRKVTAPSGSIIFVGRNNRQNDTITFKVAQPRDLWFHTKDIPGSHVILRVGDPSQRTEDMEKAAHLAAWFSKARSSANVPVDYTERRHVKKPSGAKPGFVIYEKQKTLWVTPDEKTVEALLKN